MSYNTPNTTDPTPGQEQKPLVRGQLIPNVIDDDLDDSIPRSRSNPTFGASQRFLNETQADDALTPTFPGSSSMFQSARQFDIGGNPSFVNGTQHVYNYNHYNHSTGKLVHASRSNERRVDIINKLGEEVKELYQLLQEKTDELSRVEDTANQQNAKQTRELEQLNAEVGKLNQLLQEKTNELSRVQDTANQQNAKQTRELEQLNAEVGKLNQLLQERTDELSLVESASNHQAKKLKQLEGELGMLIQLLQEKTTELAILEATTYPQNEKLKEDLKQSNAEIGKLNQLLQEKTAEEAANRVKGKRETVADSVSATEVAHLVKTLNAQIEQTVVLISESLSCLEPPVSDKLTFDELHDHLGPWLYTRLRGNSGLDLWITQVFTLQTGLANMCCCIVNDSPFWCNGSIYRHIYRNMAETDQTIADEWRAQTLNYITLAQCEDANKKYLTEKVLKLVTVAAGGIPENSESLLSQYNQRVEEIASSTAKLHKTITEDVRSVELVTYTVPCDTEFDSSRMEDTVNMSSSIPHGKVVCTHEMGLLCRKRVEPRKPQGSVKDWNVILKARVVLAATLGADNDN